MVDKNIEKVYFACVDKKDYYNVQFFPNKMSIPGAKPLEENGKIVFYIIFDKYRAKFISQHPPFDAVTYAKRLIEAKGRGKYSYGKAKIVWTDLRDNKEYCCAIVNKTTEKKFVPIEPRRKKVKL